jgi:hypothetical protein
MEKQVDNSLQLGKATKKGLVTGTIAASAVYGATQSIATASLSTNIAILFGTTTATEATLGFLGGGSIAMGSAVIGGIALGPALAIGGFVMASKAEESLTEAVKYESDVDKKIAQIIEIELIINSIEENLKELSSAINKMAKIFDEVKVDAHLDEQSLAKMFAVGKSLKGLLDISVLKEDGSANNIKTQISGYLEV